MNKDRLCELISRKLSREATPAELEELAAFLQKSPGDQYFTEMLASYWNSTGNESPAYDINSDEHFDNILRMADDSANSPLNNIVPFNPQTKGHRNKFWFRRVAVIAILVITAGFVSWLVQRKNDRKSQVISANQKETVVKKGIRSKIILPDGTVVLLNSGTRVKYPESFKGTMREVYLDGEAYFDVVKDNKRPFVVHTSGMDIKVIGTAFNVKAYASDRQTETSLIRGSIEVTIKNRLNERIILSPSEKLVVMNEKVERSAGEGDEKDVIPELVIQRLVYNVQDSTVEETQWMGDKLVFNNESFSDVAVMMERWYDVEIEIGDTQLRQKRLTGSFDKENIEQALEALSITNPFTFERKGDKIIIHR